MTRFRSVLVAVVLAGCAGPAPIARPFIPASAAPASAFAVDDDAFFALPQTWRQKVDPAELLEQLVDFPGVRLRPDEEMPGDLEPVPMVASILREFVAPGKWPAHALSVEDGTLVATQPPALLSAFQSALRTLRDNRGRMIRTRVRLYELRADGLEEFENIPPVGGGLVGTFERNGLEKALREADAHGRYDAALHLTTFHGQKSHVMYLSQKSYVAGFAQAGAADPELAIATEGVVMEMRSIANGARTGEFLISFEVQLASPAEVVDVRLGSGVVQMPAQGYARLSGRCALRSDQGLLVVTRNPDRNADRPLLALSVALDWAE